MCNRFKSTKWMGPPPMLDITPSCFIRGDSEFFIEDVDSLSVCPETSGYTTRLYNSKSRGLLKGYTAFKRLQAEYQSYGIKRVKINLHAEIFRRLWDLITFKISLKEVITGANNAVVLDFGSKPLIPLYARADMDADPDLEKNAIRTLELRELSTLSYSVNDLKKALVTNGHDWDKIVASDMTVKEMVYLLPRLYVYYNMGVSINK